MIRRAGEDLDQAFCAIVLIHPLTRGCTGLLPAPDAFTEGSQATPDSFGELAILSNMGTAFVGDRLKLRRIRRRGQITFLGKTG